MRAKRASRSNVDKVPVSARELDFCQRRTSFLLSDLSNQPLTLLLANAYHQGLTDAVEMYEQKNITPLVAQPLMEPWIEP